MTDTYTTSDGLKLRIADMPTPYLINAHKKAVATEERRHTWAADYGKDYSNRAREAEIDAMAAEIDRRASADQTA